MKVGFIRSEYTVAERSEAVEVTVNVTGPVTVPISITLQPFNDTAKGTLCAI